MNQVYLIWLLFDDLAAKFFNTIFLAGLFMIQFDLLNHLLYLSIKIEKALILYCFIFT